MSLIQKTLKKSASRDSVDSTISPVSDTVSDRESIMSSSTLSECKGDRPSMLLAFEQFQGGRLTVMVQELKQDKIGSVDGADASAGADNDNDSSISDGEDLASCHSDSCHSDNDSTISQRGTDSSTTTSAQEQERQQDQDNDNLDESESESNHTQRSSQPKSRYSIHQPKSEICFEFCSRAAVVSIVFVVVAAILCLLMAGLCSCGCINICSGSDSESASGSGQASTSTSAQAEDGNSNTADGGMEDVLTDATQSLDLGSQGRNENENDNTKTEQKLRNANEKSNGTKSKSATTTSTATSGNSNADVKDKDKNTEAKIVDRARATKRKNTKTKSSPKQIEKKKADKAKKGNKKNNNSGLKQAQQQNQKKSPKSMSKKSKLKNKIAHSNKNTSASQDKSNAQKETSKSLREASSKTAVKKNQNKDEKSKVSKAKIEEQKTPKQQKQIKETGTVGEDNVGPFKTPQPKQVENESEVQVQQIQEKEGPQIQEASKGKVDESETSTATGANAQAQLNKERLAELLKFIDSYILPYALENQKKITTADNDLNSDTRIWIEEQIKIIDEFKIDAYFRISDLEWEFEDLVDEDGKLAKYQFQRIEQSFNKLKDDIYNQVDLKLDENNVAFREDMNIEDTFFTCPITQAILFSTVERIETEFKKLKVVKKADFNCIQNILSQIQGLRTEEQNEKEIVGKYKNFKQLWGEFKAEIKIN